MRLLFGLVTGPLLSDGVWVDVLLLGVIHLMPQEVTEDLVRKQSLRDVVHTLLIHVSFY